MPPPYSVSPSSAAVGETVIIEAQDSDCDPRYGENAEVNVTLTDAGGKKIISTTAPMTDAGGFKYSFQLPTNTAHGEAAVEAYPHDVDWCDDTGKNNRVSEAEKPFIRASCAARIEPLLVTEPE